MKKLLLLLYLPAICTLASGVHPSIILNHEYDFQSCPVQIEKVVKQFNSKNIQLIPTLHFKAKSKNNLTALCFKRDSGICKNVTAKTVKLFKNYMKTCLDKAVALGVDTITITPHLDDALGSGSGIWRNNIKLDPKRKMPEISYRELVIVPIYDLIQELPTKIKFNLFLQGEMGASLFKFSNQYQLIVNELRKKNHPNLNIGVSFNHNYVGGTYIYKKNEISELLKLLKKIDVIAFSNYMKVSKRISFKSFNQHISEFRNEFTKLGINLPEGIPVYFNEVGLGGGKFTDDGKTPATTARAVGLAPYAGIRGTYVLKQDPWQNTKLAAYRKNYYKSLLDFTKYYKLDAYLWNSDSWDVLGLYRGHENYADKDIIELYKNQ